MNNEFKNLEIDFNNEDQCIELIESGMKLGEIPLLYRTPKVCLAAFEKTPWSILEFPDDLEIANEKDLIIEAIEKDSNIFKKLSYDKKDVDVCLKAFEKNPSLMKHFPDDNPELFTEELCLEAVEYDDTIFKFIPYDYRTTKVSLLAFDKDVTNIIYFNNNSEAFHEDLCTIAINRDYNFLGSIPEECRTTKLCLLAFEINVNAIRYFPVNNSELFTEDICIRAIQKNKTNIKYIPKEYITDKVKSTHKMISDIFNEYGKYKIKYNK